MIPNDRLEALLDDELIALLSRYIDGALSEAETAQLRQRLLDEPELRVAVLVFTSMHAELMWSNRGMPLTSALDSTNAQIVEAMLDEALEDLQMHHAPPRSLLADLHEPHVSLWTQSRQCLGGLFRRLTQVVRLKIAQTLRRLERIRVVMAVAAPVVLIVMLLLISKYSPFGMQNYPAIISHSQGVDKAWRVGTEVARGPHTLEHGAVELTLDTGQTVLLEGPVQFELTNAPELTLTRGAVTVDCGAIEGKFTVHTPHGSVVDLGTAFGVRASADKGMEFAVFEGRVGATVRRDDQDVAGSWIEFMMGEAGRVDTNSSDVEKVPVEEGIFAGNFVRSWSDVVHRPQITGPVIYYPNAPASILRKHDRQPQMVYLFREAIEHELQADLEITPLVAGQTQTGGADLLKMGQVLPAGTRVNSFVLQASEQIHMEWKVLNFSLKFPGRLLGVIATEATLMASNAEFGTPELKGHVPAWRGFGFGMEEDDLLNVSEDAQTLAAQLTLHNQGDVIRILVEPSQ